MNHRISRLFTLSIALLTGSLVALGPSSPSGATPSVTPKLSLGQYHSCALKFDGTVWCWGENEHGQLGDGTTTDRLTPTQVDITDVVDVAAGYDFSCALKSTGTVWCWGDNVSGQIGDGTGTYDDRPSPTEVDGLSDVTSIDAGWKHACAILEDSSAVCWGYNFYGQLGNNNTTDSDVPVTVIELPGPTNLTNVVELSLGEDHSCARMTGGTVKCWGYNGEGELGDGTGTGTDSSTPVDVDGLVGAVEIDAGAWHTCARTSTGRVWCWGYNAYGQLGDGTIVDSNVPVAVTGLTNAVSITAGGNFSCAERATGRIACWGRNYDGQLGDLSQIDRSEFVLVEEVSNPTSLDAGQWHTCAILASGSITCWGDNESGQSGDGTRHDTRGLVESTVTSDSSSISGGYDHSCAIRGGLVRCWGDNEYGQLGDNSTDVHLFPGVVDEDIHDAGQLSSGDSYSCAVTLSMEAWCWGYNGDGQLGDNSILTRDVPVRVSPIDLDGAGLGTPSDEVYAGIDAGWRHTCAIASNPGPAPWDPSVWCWGENGDGQLGDDSVTDRRVPVRVTGLGDATEIGVGYSHSCARKSDGTVWCWGDNASGQLGDGSGADSDVPVQVSGIATATTIAVGKWSTCALLTNKTVKCWGWGGFGQLGDGSGTDSDVPVPVSDIENATEIISGESFRCVLNDDGTVQCWGRNADGQLGDHTAIDRRSPVYVDGLEDVEHIFEGFFNVCASTNDDVFCWGDNEGGQFGDGTVIDTRNPVTVSGLNLLTTSSGGGRSRGGGGGSSSLGPTYTVTLDPAGGVCIDAGSHSTAWSTRFSGQRAIPGAADCSRAGYRLGGWANVTTPGITLPLETETNATGQVRYIVRANLSLIAVWTPLTAPITDLGVFANFGCSSCTNAWVYFTRPANTTDFEVTLGGSPATCAVKGYYFDLALCELVSLTPGSTIDIGATPMIDGVRGPRTTTRLTLNG